MSRMSYEHGCLHLVTLVQGVHDEQRLHGLVKEWDGDVVPALHHVELPYLLLEEQR